MMVFWRTQKGVNMNVFGYSRISSDGQETNTSIKSQNDAIRAFCKSKNWTLVRVFSDTSTGSNINRPALSEMLTEINDKGIGAVIVARIDRLSRSTIDGLTLIEKWEKQNIGFISIQEAIETNTPVGKACLGVLLSFSQLERNIIRERMAKGKQQRIREGKRCSGYIYGYTWSGRGADKRLVPVAEEAAVVQLIFKLATKLNSNQAIADHLNAKGYRNRRGKEWSTFSVRRILQNKTYSGTLKYGSREYKSDLEKIVSPYTWNRANDA